MDRENSGTSVISRYLNERVSFVNDISIEEIVSEKIANHPFKGTAVHFNREILWP